MFSLNFKFLFFGVILALALAASVNPADAASLYLLPGAKELAIGQIFNVDVIVNTDDIAINAAEGVIHYPVSVLKLESVDLSGSIFNFWVEDPSSADDSGNVNFIGGTPRGVTGEALKVFRLTFKVSGVGDAVLTIADGSVIASDGKGTNVLSDVSGINIKVGTKTDTTQLVPVEVAPETNDQVQPTPQVVELPQPVERTPTRASNLPGLPQLRVPLYPDQDRWYNQVGDVIALWDLPSDISAVETGISQSQSKQAGESDKQLYTGKNFGVLAGEGTWYIRARFKNNIGFGDFAYYKISLDTTPPLPFSLSIDNATSDNPTPTIDFETQDSLSGIQKSWIIVDNNQPLELTAASSTAMTATLSVQPPGNHTIKVKVFDGAGNSTEDEIAFEILPLPRPTVDFITAKVPQEELVFAAGSAIANGLVDVSVINGQGQIVFSRQTESDSLGKWTLSIEQSLVRGNYTLSVVAHDERQASSYPSEPASFRIKPKVIISFGLIDLGWFEIVIILILSFLSLAGVAAWYYAAKQQRRAAYQAIASRDIIKLSDLLSADLKQLHNWTNDPAQGLSSRAKTEVEYRYRQINKTIGKFKKYIGREVSKLK